MINWMIFSVFFLRSNKDKVIDIINVYLLGMLIIKMDKIINYLINLCWVMFKNCFMI